MPLKGFICPMTRERVPLDHFDSCEHRLCPDGNRRTAFSPWLARHIAEGTLNDVRHAGIDLTSTRCMSCPRSALIAMTMDYWLDPRQRAVTNRGTALHSVAAIYANPEVFYTESNDPVRMVAIGTLFPQLVEVLGVDGQYVTDEGVVVSAKLDAVRRDMSELINWKFPKDWSVRWRKQEAKDMHQIQANIERLLLSQQRWALDEGLDPNRVRLTIWDHAIGDTEGPAPLSARHMSEEEILRAVPGSTEKQAALYTVAEIVEMWVTMRRQYDKASGNPEAVRALAASVPCVGESQFNGQGCLKYCDVTAESARLMREFGRPEEIATASDEEGA